MKKSFLSMKRNNRISHVEYSYSTRLIFSLFVLVRTLIKTVQKLNVNALCSVVFLPVRGQHHFKEIRFRFFIVHLELTLAIIQNSNLACSRHCQFRYFQHNYYLHKVNANNNFYCDAIISA